MGTSDARWNWAGTVRYAAAEHAVPASLDEVRDRVATAARVRALGTRHSFNRIADTPGLHLSLARLDRLIAVDPDAGLARIEGGAVYGPLAQALEAGGVALANMASLPHISVAGAVSTGTHGSGSRLGGLATQVAALTVVTPDGGLRRFDGAEVEAAAVGLGALGPIVEMTLRVEPDYAVRQTVWLGLGFDALARDPVGTFDAGTSVSVFTDWQGDETRLVLVKDRTGQPRPDLPEARPAEAQVHPVPGGRPSDCTPQLGQPGPWHARLPHFRMDFTPSHGEEIQAELFLPRAATAEAIALLRRHGPALAQVLLVSELRTIAADTLWLSPASRGDQLAVHFTFRRDWPAVRPVLAAIEADLAPLGALPHWGKVTTLPPEAIAAGFPRLGAFRDLVRAHDPAGKFANATLEALFAVLP